MEGMEEGGQALKVNNGGERSQKTWLVQGGRRVFIGGEKYGRWKQPTRPDGPAESPAGPDASPDVRRPTERIRRWAEKAARTPVRLDRRNGPVRRRTVRPGARPGRTRGRNGQPKNQLTFARKFRMR
jgi:hypothetical protein